MRILTAAEMRAAPAWLGYGPIAEPLTPRTPNQHQAGLFYSPSRCKPAKVDWSIADPIILEHRAAGKSSIDIAALTGIGERVIRRRCGLLGVPYGKARIAFTPEEDDAIRAGGRAFLNADEIGAQIGRTGKSVAKRRQRLADMGEL